MHADPSASGGGGAGGAAGNATGGGGGGGTEAAPVGSSSSSGGSAGGTPFEWSVCPGAAESASMSEVPHGTIIAASAFTSLSLLHCALAAEEKAQYEVHLLTSGLLQCGWCVTPSGLPFTGQEGVGDFPMSVAADGLRGLVWNLTSVDVPELRWSVGDTLSCYADLATGVFDFALNGVHCHSATLPTKVLLLRHGARWYSDRHSTDEMLQYTPAMSLEGGEACVVNLGEAPMRYPRRGYRTICETFWYEYEERHDNNSSGSTAAPPGSGTVYGGSESPVSGGVTEGVVTRTAAASHGGNSAYVSAISRSSSSNSSFGAQFNAPSTSLSNTGSGPCCRLTLGGVEMNSFVRSVGLCPPTDAIPPEGTYVFYRLLDPWVGEPARVVERCARLVSWLQADAPVRWKAFTVWLYLWITRFYVDLRETSEMEEEPENLDGYVVLRVSAETTPTSADTLAQLNNIWHALELFMPPPSFARIPGMILALLQHRCSDSAEAQVASTQIALDLVSLRSFRQTWVADTTSFTSTLLNLFMIRPPSGAQREALSRAFTTHVPDDFIVQPDLTAQTCAHQTRMWRLAAQVVDTVVCDPSCRGALSVAVLRYLTDRRLKMAIAVAHRGAEATNEAFLDAYPYTFTSAFSPIVLGFLTLSLTAALGRCMPPLSESEEKNGEDAEDGVDDDGSAAGLTASQAVLQRELGWRAVAMQWLPPARFYGRPLASPPLPPPPSANAPDGSGGDAIAAVVAAAAAKDIMADRLGGSLPSVSANIETEVARLTAALAATAHTEANTPIDVSGGQSTARGDDSSPPSRQNTMPADTRPTSLNAAGAEWQAAAAAHLAARGLFTGLPTDLAGLGLSVPAPIALAINNTTTAVPAHASPHPSADSRARLEAALAERAGELFLVVVVAFDTYVRGLLARCATLPSAIYDAVVAYQRSVSERSAVTETWNSTTSLPAGEDEVSRVRHLFELLLTTVPLRNGDHGAALARFCGTVGRVYGYYWARMAVFERRFCMPGHPSRRCQEMEATEAAYAPPRAFLMLPAQLSNTFVDLWLLLGLVHGRNADIAREAPTLFRFFFDANMRRATSNLFAREYLYQTVTSVLGANRTDRLRIAQQVAQMHRDNPAESADRLSFFARHFADLLSVLQRSPNERAPVNFLSSLLQEEMTLVPQPRMLDEKFGWLLCSSHPSTRAAEEPTTAALMMAGKQSTNDVRAEGNTVDDAAAVATTVSVATADEIYLQLFRECTAQYTPAALLFPLIYHCNALLSRFNERMPPPRSWSGASRDTIASFFTLYQVLRKTLCAMHAVCEGLLYRRRTTTTGGQPGGGAVVRPSLTRASFSASTLGSADDSDPAGSDAVAEEDSAALRRELMDVLMQCLLRVMGPPSSPPSSSVPASVNTGAEQQQQQRSPVAHVVPPNPRLLSATAVFGDRGAFVAADANVLQPAVVCDVSGVHHWRETSCTKVGLIAPILSMLQCFAEVHGTTPTTNRFLAALGADLPAFVQAALAALSNTAWWTSANAGTAAGAMLLPEKLRRLQGCLREMEAASVSLFPAAGLDATITTTTTTATTTASTLPGRRPSNPRQFSQTSVFSRSPSNASDTAAEELPASHAQPLRSPTSPRGVATGDDDDDDDASNRGSDVAGDTGPPLHAEEPAETCLICLSRPNDVRMLPCGHECCYGCYRRYQRVEHARQVAMEGSGHTWSSMRSPSPPLTSNLSHANSEASAAYSTQSPQVSDNYHDRAATTEEGEAEQQPQQPPSSLLPGLQVLTDDAITLDSVELSIAAADYTAVRCFFCKETVESVQHIFKPTA